MRTFTIKVLLRLLNRVDKEYKYEPFPKNKYDTLERIKVLIDRVNGTMKQIPNRYYFWIDRDGSRSKLTLREFDVNNQKQVYPVVYGKGQSNV
jgi:hypothetical protein